MSLYQVDKLLFALFNDLDHAAGMVGNTKPSFTDYIAGKNWSTAATLATWQPRLDR